jgi:hypothetical protein
MNAVLTSVDGIARAGRVLASQDRSHRATLPVLLTVDEWRHFGDGEGLRREDQWLEQLNWR